MAVSVRSASIRNSRSTMSPIMERSVEQYSDKKLHYSVHSSTIVGERVICFLRNIHPAKTAENVAADTGVAAATVKKWMERSSVPSGLAMMRLIATYGPEFLVAAFPSAPLWLRDASRAYRIAKLSQQQEALQRELDELV